MARVVNNSVFACISGAIGKELVFKHYKDKTVVSRYPDMSRVEPSERQKLQRKVMSEANKYASQARKDEKLKAFYEQDLQAGETVFHKAKNHFFEMVKRGEVVVRL